MSASPDSPRLQLTAISKQYPGCLANDRIDLAIAPGEIRALLGENGAGKSTLVKCVAGFQRPTAGSILIDGREQAIPNPVVARALGIGMVYQHFTLAPGMTVAENLLAAERLRGAPPAEDRLDSALVAFDLPSLAAKAATAESLAWAIPADLASGTYYIGIAAGAVPGESSSTDNAYAISFTVTGPAADSPNMVINDLSVGSAAVRSICASRAFRNWWLSPSMRC